MEEMAAIKIEPGDPDFFILESEARPSQSNCIEKSATPFITNDAGNVPGNYFDFNSRDSAIQPFYQPEEHISDVRFERENDVEMNIEMGSSQNYIKALLNEEMPEIDIEYNEIKLESDTDYSQDNNDSSRMLKTAGSDSIKKPRLPSRSRRTQITLLNKLGILNDLENGRKMKDLAVIYNISVSMIKNIIKNKEHIRERITAEHVRPQGIQYNSDFLSKIECSLIKWIEDYKINDSSQNHDVIKQKALEIANMLRSQEDTGVNTSFTASDEWFHHFTQRLGLKHSLQQLTSSPGIVRTANKYHTEFLKTVHEGGYSAEQVFDADETVIYWRSIPKQRLLTGSDESASDYSPSKERITLLLCSNASGHCVMKPLIINASKNSKCLQKQNQMDLPVYWQANRRLTMSRDIFTDWFHNCFAPDVEKYLKSKGICFKAVLLIDNAPYHPPKLEHPNIKVIYSTPAAAILQPSTQGIIEVFKTFYIRQTCEIISKNIERHPHISILEALKNMSLWHCMDSIQLCSKELNPSMLNSCWRNLWPEVISDTNTCTIKSTIDYNIRAAIDIARRIGISDINEQDINELIDYEPDLNMEEYLDETSLISSEQVIDDKSREESTSSRSKPQEIVEFKSDRGIIDVPNSTAKSCSKKELTGCCRESTWLRNHPILYEWGRIMDGFKPIQQLYVEKAINDIFHQARLDKLKEIESLPR